MLFLPPAWLPPSLADWITSDACVSLSPLDSSTQQHYSHYRNLFACWDHECSSSSSNWRDQTTCTPLMQHHQHLLYPTEHKSTVWIKEAQWGRGERIVGLVGKTKSSGYTRLELRSGCEGGTQHYQEALAHSYKPLLWLEHSTRRRTGCFVVRLPKI